MRSWVRYSVTVYLGLLLAGSIATPMPRAVAPQSNLRASYRTLSPRPVPKLDPASTGGTEGTQGNEVMGYHGPGIVWQNSARADSPR